MRAKIGQKNGSNRALERTATTKMDISAPHNLIDPVTGDQRRYGIRVTIDPADPFLRLVDPDWEKHHWYKTVNERDRAMADMHERHPYSRDTDQPTLIFEPVERL